MKKNLNIYIFHIINLIVQPLSLMFTWCIKVNRSQRYRFIFNALTYISKEEWSDLGLKKEFLVKQFYSLIIPKKNHLQCLRCYQTPLKEYQTQGKVFKILSSCLKWLVSGFWTRQEKVREAFQKKNSKCELFPKGGGSTPKFTLSELNF